MRAVLAWVLMWSFAGAQGVADKESSETSGRPTGGTVVWQRDWTSQSEIDSDWWIPNMKIKPGEPGSAKFHEAIGGAALPYTMRFGTGSLHPANRANYYSPAPLVGIVIAEFEIYVPQSYYDLPWGTDRMSHNTQKWFRVVNHLKRPGSEMPGGCASNKCNDTVLTLTYHSPSKQLWVRSLIRENLKTGWRPAADRWTKIQLRFDYDRRTFQMLADGQLVADAKLRDDPGYPLGVDALRATLHSTSRSPRKDGYFGDPNIADTFIGYRHAKIIAAPAASHRETNRVDP